MFNSVSLATALTIVILPLATLPAVAKPIPKSPKARSAEPICYMRLPNQATLNLQRLCGASQRPPSALREDPAVKSTDPALLNDVSATPDPAQSTASGEDRALLETSS
ncbi:hypothetical protein BST81_05205 [Leptolyngbya sp. 'hensonii']|uniref:hypothetical protein n=1 Tax=Leptolyngbya sp. 'hensonii' TaxID=1922337 RepID=UPI00094FFD86|nr:hypothetical protein [Leptolyngbya sp. 'hensonii']OLP19469.1 hypothetical protein BST81_05205 [Leptolyngbya sp. 'hensonii']